MGGFINFAHASLVNTQFNIPVNIVFAQLNLATRTFEIKDKGLKIGPIGVDLIGKPEGKGYQFHFLSDDFPISMFRDESDFFTAISSISMPTLYNTAGFFQIEGSFGTIHREVIFHFLDAGASLKGLKYPVYQVNGDVHFTLTDKGFQGFTDNLVYKYANGLVEMSFDMTNLDDLYVEVRGTIAPLLINEFLHQLSPNMIAYAAIPFNIDMSGAYSKMEGQGEGNDLYVFFNFNIASLFSDPGLARPTLVEQANVEQKLLGDARLSSVFHLLGDTLTLEETKIKFGEGNSITFQGVVSKLFTSIERVTQVSLITEPTLNLDSVYKIFPGEFTQGLKGKIDADLTFIHNHMETLVQGKIGFDHVSSQALQVVDLDGYIQYMGEEAQLVLRHVQIPGVDIHFEALLSDLFTFPLMVEDFKAEGKQVIIPLYTLWVREILHEKLQKRLWEQFFPNTGKPLSLFFQILDGSFNLNEVIVDNVIVENFVGRFRVYANAYFEIYNFKAKAAGGHVKGSYSTSRRDNGFISVQLDIEGMEANAVSRVVMNMSNQIFGDLNGTINYTTEGSTPEELLSNVNGSANLMIENGRLPGVAKMENLLVAANTIHGGLANLNLNSLFRLAKPFQTNYFAKLDAKVRIAEGIVYLEELYSDGNNLDLRVNGIVRMVDGYGDLTLHGKMDKQISGVLGQFGRISIGGVVGILPPLKQIINRIPGIGFIPGFGGPSSDSGVSFEVKLIGPIEDPGSVQGFEWVN